jgi:nucleotide-binding universal stress UspA family protein
MAGRQVVVGYDGSHFSGNALAWAAREAQARGVALLIAHAESPAPAAAYQRVPVDAEKEMLLGAAEVARLLAPDVDVRTGAVPGPVVESLLRLMADAEVGVVGCRGLGATAEQLVGSTSLQLAARMSRPLVVVRTVYYAVPGPDAGRVVVGVDGLPGASAAIDFAIKEAKVRGCGLTAIHAWDPVCVEVYDADGILVERLPAQEEHRAFEAMTEWLAPWTDRYPEVDIRRRPVCGTSATQLVRASAGAELFVVGARGVSGVRSQRLGSVSDALLHRADCPVAVVHVPLSDRAGSET